ncbi:MULTISPECIES: EscU/YscU/HrcU family type III secretion system export apparatus switch protein [unclassified Treponema]|uniref:EscU/YscU/HrcU family type III secretion system export apparatus switch protein n=1 Tax=unclassified Treponema TaxID=2638727 RepID=UPI0020A4C87C|nr:MULTISPECIES: EscU/YscU/HrcU family type III secretion system export apparatus switch protein [unclassified Treponema]UTC66078.1 EscU/YscU/HrcU family type III secretion system export apparatus switch protein [Treponema sp. OMZ 789]UTC68808.1 EscU/YscU/HrcU family type III secretion system export apparatus switch protein [Treponema sp. OMZ 790]UTC71536.1 EscU/YscU/HrcU family type III secretion system export apparatus switch protein [Treponema sp. OMZ 791]
MIENNKKKVDCAVALSYALHSKAPIITASGKGLTAKKIKETAERNGIRIVEDENLTNILIHQEIGSCIPEYTYKAVAAIFAFLLKKD